MRERTPIERAGTPGGMVLHQPSGLEQPELLPRIVEAGGLAIEIARLPVELRRQLAEVEASRARIVAAGDQERRRIERDLHDGANSGSSRSGLRCAMHSMSWETNRFTVEWTGYFALADTILPFEKLEKWLRRRLG